MDDGRSLAGQFTLRWTAPPGWANPPDDFMPEVHWRPDRYWPKAPQDWDFWQVVADDDIVDLFDQPLPALPSDPDPIWVPPPHWPTPPAGWHPPTGWTPDRTWRPAPPGWEFWQQPEVDHRANAAALLSTRSGRLRQLNIVEDMFRSFAEHLVLSGSHEITVQLVHTPGVYGRRQMKNGIRGSNEAAVEALTNARDGLLRALRRDVPADDATIEWQAVVVPRIDDAIAWTNRVLKRRGAESPQARRVRLLNSLPYGATSSIPTLGTGATDEIQVLSGAVEWQEAERLAAIALQQFGFSDASVTVSGADAGIDVASSRIVAQVKYLGKPVGRPVLQQLVGAGDGRATACFSRMGYSQQAREYADERGVALFTITLPTTIEPLNAAARALARRRHG